MQQIFAAFAVLLVLPLSAAAQDFGADWIDRIGQEMQQERGPQLPKAATFNAFAGFQYSYDDNLFLSEKNKEKSHVLIPFLRGRFDYATPTMDVRADLLANYKFYTTDHDLDDNEERFYLSFRQVGAKHSIELVEIFQHLSNPVDSIFFDRQERVVSTTIPKITFDLTDAWTIEAKSEFNLVRFRKSPTDDLLDNNSARTDATLVWRNFQGFSALAQFGYINIDYNNGQSRGAPPDAFGYYYRLGVRGDIVPGLSVEVLAGYTTIETDYLLGTRQDAEDDDLDALVSIRYEITETFRMNAGFARLFTFAGGADSYQLVNRATIGAEWDATQELTFHARAQFDRADTQTGVDREFLRASISADYRILENVTLDAGVVYRRGKTVFDNEVDTDFSNLILQLGFVVLW